MPDRVEDPVLEEALRWFVVLHDASHDDNDRQAFERWRAADAAHEAAWQRAQAVWARADILKPAFGRSSGTAATPVPVPVPRARRLGRRRWLQAAAAAAVAVPAAIVASRPELWADHRTAPGERRTVRLADGSTVELAGASALSVSFAAGTRQLRLVAGEAFFSVAPEARPFVVAAGEGRSRALGTAFNIKLAGDTVTVTVTEHRVEVTGPDRRVEVEQGQQVRYDARTLQAPRPADLRAVEGWRRDRLVFQDATLAEVVADLERSRGGRIVLTDSRLRALPVTAVFDARQADAALATIADILPIRLHRVTDWLVVLSPR
jgi:transmembrane sensor